LLDLICDWGVNIRISSVLYALITPGKLFELKNCTFINCGISSSGGDGKVGGAIFVYNDGSGSGSGIMKLTNDAVSGLVIENSSFSKGTTSTSHGGSIYADGVCYIFFFLFFFLFAEKCYYLFNFCYFFFFYKGAFNNKELFIF
jgi:hypothetical protein